MGIKGSKNVQTIQKIFISGKNLNIDYFTQLNGKKNNNKNILKRKEENSEQSIQTQNIAEGWTTCDTNNYFVEINKPFDIENEANAISKSSLTNKSRNYFKNDILGWEFELYDKFDTEIINELTKKVECEIKNNNEKISLVFLCENLIEDIKIILNHYKTIPKKLHPLMVILKKNHSDDEKEVEKYMKEVKSNFDYRNLQFLNYDEKDILSLGIKLLNISFIYNNLGDDFLLPDNIFGQPNNEIEKDLRNKHHYTFNILMLGRPGCGKSTLTNLIMEKMKTREGVGLCVTNYFIKCIHDQYPISVYDSPGFENRDDLQKVKTYLHDIKNRGDNIHLILYLVNAQTSRTFIGEEIEIIKYLMKKNIQIFFLITRSVNEEKGKDFLESVKINLFQTFGDEFANSVKYFPVQLIDEIESDEYNEKKNIKSFGLDILFKEIKEEILSERILRDIDNLKKKNDIAKLNEALKGIPYFKNISSLDKYIKRLEAKSWVIISRSALCSILFCMIDFYFGASAWVIFQLTMVKSIGKIYGKNFSEEENTKILKGTGIGAVASISAFGILKFIPILYPFITIIESCVFSLSIIFLGKKCIDIFSSQMTEEKYIKEAKEDVDRFVRGVNYFDNLSKKFDKKNNINNENK